jgi:hypothetical protein
VACFKDWHTRLSFSTPSGSTWDVFCVCRDTQAINSSGQASCIADRFRPAAGFPIEEIYQPEARRVFAEALDFKERAWQDRRSAKLDDLEGATFKLHYAESLPTTAPLESDPRLARNSPCTRPVPPKNQRCTWPIGVCLLFVLVHLAASNSLRGVAHRCIDRPRK